MSRFITGLAAMVLVSVASEANASKADERKGQIATPADGADTSWREDFAYLIGMQAYIYGFPAMNFAQIRHDWVEAHTSAVRAKGNVYTHYPRLVGPEYQYGTSMNRDTLYSLAWSYVGHEPLVFTIPANPDGRYYSIEFNEWYTDAFGYMGNRTTRDEPAAYLVHAPSWQGTVPDGIDKVLEAPTPWFIAVGRTYTTNTPDDLDMVRDIQRGYKIFPLSEWGSDNPREAEPIEDVLDVHAKDQPLGRFKTMNAAMRENPPPERDEALMRQFALVGLGPYATGSLDDQPEDVRRGLERAERDAQALLQKTSQSVGSITNQNRTVNGWTYNPANWCRMAESADFLGRAATQALSGGLENCIEEAVKLRTFTDQNGDNLNGDNRYVLRFASHQIPQVNAFWSITLYDNGFNLVANTIEKYAVRDIDPDLVLNEDGSLAIHIQAERPDAAGVNWLPAPPGEDFNLFFRAYLPGEDFMSQQYEPPQVRRVY